MADSEPPILPSNAAGSEPSGAEARLAAPEFAAKELVGGEPPASQGYWRLVWLQFKKNRLALWSLVIMGLLLLVSAWAPVLAHGRPFVWHEDGKTTYPFFEYLVAPDPITQFFGVRLPMSIDYLFNYFLFLSLSLPLIVLPVWKLVQRAGMPERVRVKRVWLAILAAFVAAMLPFFNPHTYERAAKPEERVNGSDMVQEFTLFQRWRLDARDYTYDRKELNAARGDYAIFPPIPFNPISPTPDVVKPPSGEHWLGTDSQGRDVLARMLHGGRISMSVGFVAVSIATFLGILIGGLAGYYRGWVDIVISRLVELMICFPTFFLIITIIAFIEERSVFHIMLILGFTSWTGVARLIRGEFLKLADQDFVTAARALGCSGTRVMFRHILPNALGPVLVSAAFGVAGAVLTESSLSYLGFGAPPPTPTWGEMISQGKQYIDEAWWLMFFPGLSIFLTVTVYNLAGDGLRDAMDPKMRR
jgi:peptide/nickel transport system permease protein